MATSLDDLNTRLSELKDRQTALDEQSPVINPVDAITDVTTSVTTAAEAASAATTASVNAASSAASAAGYASAASRARTAVEELAPTINDAAAEAATSASSALASKNAAYSSAATASADAETASSAQQGALSAYEGALEAYSGTIEVLADVEAIRASTVETWQNIQNSIYTPTYIEISDEGALTWANPETHKIYYSASMPVTNLTVSFTEDYYAASVEDIQYITELHFISHSTIQSSYSDDLIYWSGNDCASGKFVPAGNRVYDIVLASNMERLRGYVSGTPTLAAAAATMSLRPTREEAPVVWVLYINETSVQYAPKYVVIDGTVYTNPDESRLIEAGYKPLYVDERPEEEEGYYIDSTYEDTEEAVLQHWTKILVEVPVESTEEDPEDVPVEVPEEDPVEMAVEVPVESTEELPEEAPVDTPEEV